MARQVVGKAAFRYASTGATVETEVRLGTPLHDLEFDESRTRFVAEALDQVNREVVTIGPAFDQVKGRVRFHAEPAELVDLKTAGLDGTKLRYVPNTAEPAFQYHVRLVEAGALTPDPQRAGRKEFQQQLTLRQWSSTAEQLDSLVYGRRLLFQYEPGRDLAQIGAVFSSTGGGTYTDSYGTTGQVAAANKARDAHYQTVDGEWTRTLRLESAANEVLYFPWPHKPQAMTVYVSWVAQDVTSSDEIFQVGSGGGNSRFDVVYAAAGLDMYLKDGVGNLVGSGATVTKTVGSRYELVAQVYADASVQLHISKDSAAVVSGSRSTAPGAGLPASWSAEALYVTGPNAWGAGDYALLKVAPGVRSMAYMRGAP